MTTTQIIYRAFRPAISRRLYRYSVLRKMSVQIKPRILLTKTLPLAAQKRIESFDKIELIHWKDGVIPRGELLNLVKGKQ